MDRSRPPRTLVAVPGLGLGPEGWLPTLAELGLGRPSIRLLPGYGVPVVGRARSPRELGAALAAGLPRHDGGVVLLGHSASCQVVAHAAALRPDVVAGLVLVGPTTDPRARSWPALVRRWLRTSAHEDLRQVPSLVRQYVRTGLRSILATMDRARRDDVVSTLALVGCPVVLVRGAHDRIAPASWLRALEDAGSGRTVVVLPAGAHMVPITHPRLVAEVVRDAMARWAVSLIADD